MFYPSGNSNCLKGRLLSQLLVPWESTLGHWLTDLARRGSYFCWGHWLDEIEIGEIGSHHPLFSGQPHQKWSQGRRKWKLETEKVTWHLLNPRIKPYLSQTYLQTSQLQDQSTLSSPPTPPFPASISLPLSVWMGILSPWCVFSISLHIWLHPSPNYRNVASLCRLCSSIHKIEAQDFRTIERLTDSSSSISFSRGNQFSKLIKISMSTLWNTNSFSQVYKPPDRYLTLLKCWWLLWSWAEKGKIRCLLI